MKQFVLFLIICCASFLNSFAQQPTTTWPYIYNQFTDAVVYLKAGGKQEYKANIHLQKSRLHYIDGENILESKMGDVLLVEMGGKRYMNINNSLMEIVRESEKGFIAKESKPDFTKMNETGGAYGSSSNTTSTRALTSIEGLGSVSNHILQQANKESGKPLVLKHEYYIVSKGSIYPARKNVFEDLLPLDKKSNFKTFLKENKIKWQNPDDLLKIVEYLN